MAGTKQQELARVREEIGFQKAILNSLENAEDAASLRARLDATQSLGILFDRLRSLQCSNPPRSVAVHLDAHPAREAGTAQGLPGPPTTPISLPTRKRPPGSPTNASPYSKSQKTTPASSATGKGLGGSTDRPLDSDDLEVIDLTGDDLADTSGSIAAQMRQEKLAAQRRRDHQLAQSLQQQRGPQRPNGLPAPTFDPFQRLMQNARTSGAPKAGFQDADMNPVKPEHAGSPSLTQPPVWPGGSEAQRLELIRRIRLAQQHGMQSMDRMQTIKQQQLEPGRNLSHGNPLQPYPPGLPGAFPVPQYSPGPGPFGLSPSQPPTKVLGSTTWPTLPSTSMNDIINRTSAFSYTAAATASAARSGYHPHMPDRMRYFLDMSEDQDKISDKELEDLLANIRPDEDIPLGEREETVEGLKVKIYRHQQAALKWMQNMEDGSNKGGILADDMGLGKTVSALALMLTKRSTTRPKTNLIIGPLALIRQWEEEINSKVSSSHRLSVFVYHNKKATTDELLSYDVVLTTYGTIAAEVKRLDLYVKENIDAGRSADFTQSESAVKFPLLHPTKAKYHRVILDEAQCIKNKDTQTAKACHRLRANFRWCLTGTPMMNGVLELYSLLAFLHIRPYCAWDNFRQQFGVLFGKRGDEKSVAMSKLRALLKAIMLRRKKNTMLDGKPIVELPKKTESVVYAELSEDERDFYNQLEVKAQVQFSKYLREGSIGRNYSNILVLLLRLRQACCHPHLNLDVTDTTPVTEAEVLELVKKLKPSIVARIRTANGFECPICYDAVPSPQFFIPCGHDSCSQCLSRIADNAASANIQEGHESDKCKCPVCRGQFNPKECFTLEAFRKVHQPEAFKKEDESDDESEDESDEEVIGEADAEEDDLYSDDRVDVKGNLAGFVVDDSVFNDSDDDTDATPVAIDSIKAEVKGESSSSGSSPGSRVKPEEDEDEKEKLRKVLIKQGKRVQGTQSRKPKKTKSKGKKKKSEKEKIIKTDIRPSMLKELRIEARKSREAYRRYMNYLRQNWLPAAKVSECIRLLREAEKDGGKSIVFSQWTLLLDLIEVGMDHAGFKNKPKRYDGGMSGDERNAVARAFQDASRRDVTVMLVSLRAGNAGLNLTQARRVIIMDPFWNPYIEMQAVDRAYRIGQTQPVQVFRILTKDTVEDRIVDLKERKQAIVEAALDEAESAKIGRLGVSELKFLFNRRDD
ncbi:SNF2-related protein [Cordyceps fumosorosea ARSEF 2679]|uniref:SNF2-related protein n=1 Tax=Cordyceps fumosorosea (strain ARSEF 2679) TaxID=1081104 RepID=A0A167NF04_CORFA|nr:SNF2-related protein [Cordyceps fumosorosea ARSEF 2679]OAA55488.1 SNF2-related protein [Cordyceps fumosorosea ARSEF 2679]